MSGLLVLPSALVAVVLLVFRVVVGAAMFRHGLPKLRGGGWRQSGQWIASMGVPASFALLVGLLELLGGVFLIVGLLVPVVGFLFLLQFAGIIVMKKSKANAAFMPKGQGGGSYEVDYAYLAASIALIALGAGSLSLDALLGLY